MPLKKLLLTPAESGYTVDDGDETLSIKLDGGKARYRKDMLNATATVRVRWQCDRYEYEYLKAFYKGSASDTGATPFLLDLIIDEAFQLTEHTCYFIPGKFKLNRIRGHLHEVQADLEVIPKTYFDGYYDIIVLLYELFPDDPTGTAATAYFNAIHQLVNVEMPSIPVMQYE